MRSAGGAVVALLVTAACLTACAAPEPAPARLKLTGLVAAVADGNTLTLIDHDRLRHRIRVDGIDAPERGQPYSQISRRSLIELAQSKNANVECKKRDRYERYVCKVFVDGRDVGLEQLHRGLAWHFKRYEHEQSAADREAYAAAEDEARDKRLGLWRDAEPVAPWVYRQEQRAQ